MNVPKLPITSSTSADLIKPTSVKIQTQLDNLDKMLIMVDHIRRGVFQIFEASVVLSQSESIKRRVKASIETVGQGITELGTNYGKKLQDVLNDTYDIKNRPPIIETSLLPKLPDIYEHHKWADGMKDRANHSYQHFESELFRKFPVKRSNPNSQLPPAKRIALNFQQRKSFAESIDIRFFSDTDETFDSLDSLIREIEGQTNLSIQTFSSDDKQRVNGVKVKCEGIFKAEILFDDSNLSQNSNLIQVLRVAVFAYNEEEDVWNKSVHSLFRRITEHACQAKQFYYSHHRESALRRLLTWLSYYKDLYGAVPCRACTEKFYFDSESNNLLPPAFRSFGSGFPYHSQCYPSN